MAFRPISLREYTIAVPLLHDKIGISNLQTVANAGYDAWGRPKQQPSSISVTLHLKHTVSSSAALDDLDTSTVHYGSLSKSVLANISTASDTWQDAESFAWSLLADPALALNVAAVELDVRFPKASLLGDGVILSHLRSYEQALFCPILGIENIKLPALIGLNANERTMRQLLSITVSFDRVNETLVNRPFEAEQIVSKVRAC